MAYFVVCFYKSSFKQLNVASLKIRDHPVHMASRMFQGQQQPYRVALSHKTLL